MFVCLRVDGSRFAIVAALPVGRLTAAVRRSRQAEPWDGTGHLYVYKHCDERLDNPPRPSTRTIYTVIDELLAVFGCLRDDGSRFATVAALPMGAVCLLLYAVACRPNHGTVPVSCLFINTAMCAAFSQSFMQSLLLQYLLRVYYGVKLKVKTPVRLCNFQSHISAIIVHYPWPFSLPNRDEV